MASAGTLSPAVAAWMKALPTALRMVKFLALAGALTITVTLVLLLVISLYRLFLHPLAGLPGPRLAAISNIWQARYVRDGRARELGKTLHRKYGSVVRVGPNEVWFSSGAAFREIYRP
jgi:hypothetical protein